MSTVYGVTQEFVQSQSIGLFGKRYVGYFNDDFDFFTADKEYDTGRVFLSIDSFSSSANTYSWMWLGYFVPPTSGDYTFYTNSDGSSWMWVGEGAHRNTTVDNALVNNSGVHGLQEVSGTKYLRANKLYPVKILFGDNTSASEAITVSFSGPSIAKTTDGRGYFLSGPYLFDSLYNTTTRTYPANGYEPDLVLDFENNYFRVNGEDTDFDSALTFSRASNATMVDSDGLIKWVPHNYFWDSTFTNFSNTTGRVASNEVFTSGDISVGGRYQIFTAFSVPSAGTYRFKVDVNVIVIPSDIRIAAVQSFTGGDSIIKTVNDIVDGSITIDFNVVSSDLDGAVAFGVGASNTSTGLAEFSNPRVYRIDLGGMVNNPDQTGSLVDYVPTTGSARYLARRGHHVYNGTEWVNEGVLIESEARTNLITDSETSLVVTYPYQTTLVGTDSPAGTGYFLTQAPFGWPYIGTFNYGVSTLGLQPNTTYTFSVFARYVNLRYIKLQPQSVPGLASSGPYFNLQEGTATNGGTIEDWGNGWYRCSIQISLGNEIGGSFRAVIYDEHNGILAGDAIHIWGPQIEEGSTPSSYIPTNGATATRAAEELVIDAANLPTISTGLGISVVSTDNIPDNYTGSLHYCFSWSDTPFQSSLINGIAARHGGTSTLDPLSIIIGGGTGSSTNPRVNAGVGQGFVQNNVAVTGNSTSGGMSLALNGTNRTLNVTTTFPTIAGTSSFYLNGFTINTGPKRIKTVKIWDEDIGTAGIEEASS